MNSTSLNLWSACLLDDHYLGILSYVLWPIRVQNDILVALERGNRDYPFCMERFGISLAEMIQGTQSGGLHSQFHELYTKIDNHIYPRRTIYHMIKDLVKGLSAIHENFHVHRDLRPSNLLVCLDNPDGVRLKICDFGLARPLDKETDRTEFAMSSLAFNCHGTHPFQPPEVVRRRKDMDSKTVYSTRSDTYSTALCIYFLLTNGGHPVLYSGANYCTFSPKGYPSLRQCEEPVEMRNWYDDDEEFIISSIHEKFKSPKLTYGRDPETRAHGYYLEGIRHLPEAFDLVYQMVGKNGCVKDQRLSLAQCKEHCFFWDYSLRLEFLEIIHHIVNRAPPRQDLYDAMHVPEELAIYLPSSNVDQWDWSKIPSEKDQNWQNFLHRTQSAVVGNGGIEYDTRSLFHLLRLIRNVKCHLSDPRMGLKSCLGSLTSDSLARFLFDRFPGLISHLLQVPLLREIRDEALDKFWTKLRMSF
jgi:serine/threonine protein kinase